MSIANSQWCLEIPSLTVSRRTNRQVCGSFGDAEPYGLVDEHVLSRLLASPRPLHGGVVGTPADLARVTVDDVRSFIGERIVPANAIPTLVGRFDPTRRAPSDRRRPRAPP